MELIDIRNPKNEKAPIRAMVDRFNDNPVLKTVISTASVLEDRRQKSGDG